MHAEHAHPAPPESNEQFWEEFYADGRRPWSGRPNHSLVDEVTALAPGTALDLGCGHGGDASWLAQQGWKVTATDIAAAALEAAASHASEAGIADGAITWERHDLVETFPAGEFDLVTASYLHTPVAIPRGEILRSAAAAVAPGGTLLIIGHAPSASHPHADLPTLQVVLDELALPQGAWETATSELREQQHAFGDEEPVTRIDTVLRLRRLVA